MKGPTLALCVALLLFTTPSNADKCRTGCHGVTPNIFQYAEGTTYKYNLEGNIDISLSSAEGQQTSTKIRGTVLLNQQAECNQVISLQNVQIIGPDAKKYGAIPNIEKAIGINFHDGHVEDVICTEVGDTQNSLNIKRAVASMFQAVLDHHHETDVFGDCPTDVTSRKEGPMTIIHKTRHLGRCAHRESIKQDFMATSFNDNSQIHASPLLNAEYESEQRLKNGILDHALITENYVYKPFSNGKNGAKATVTTKITFAGTSKDAIKGKPTEPKSIHFENPHIETTKTANVDNILHALKETKKSMDISVSETSAKTFAQLIKVLRASKKDDILAVYGQIKSGAGGFTDKVSARKVFFDALFRTGTGDAVETMVELLKNKELNPIEQKLVYLSLSFIRHATPASLKSAAALVGLPDLPREAYLGMGTLAGHYCSEHDCEHVPELDKLMEKMTAKLTSTPANHKEENKVIAILKGLANIHHLSDAILDKLVTVASNKKASSRIRVATLETFLADPCKSKLRNAALNILKDREEDSEIRIKAYLVIAQCPDTKTAHALQELLDTEPVYQVGGFIVSHLRNLRASANPDREHAKQHLSMVKTSKKFPVDPRKYSFNNEFSYTIDSAGVGSSMESNVIFAQNSFLPRSTNLNLTTELFGHSFNFLEIGTRQENLDKVLEHYFGPLGVFSSHTPEELYSTGKASFGKMAEHIKNRLQKTRGRRDVSKTDIENFAKEVKLSGEDLNNDLDLDLSVKILGSEMLFLSINQDIQKLTPDAIIDKIFDCVDSCVEKAKKFEYHLKDHLLFLDVETSYPTSMGFPLRLTVEGSSAVHFMAHGSIDIQQILKDPTNAHMKVSVIPSANIEISGMMKIDAYVVETGLKVTSSILTSTGADLNIKMLENGKGVDVKMGLPVEKQKLISFTHDIVFSTQELGKPETDIALKFKDKLKEFMICFDQLSPIIGLTFCGELNTPSTLATNSVAFPLNGPAKMSLVIERDDVKEYHFRALLNNQKPFHKTLQITFDTPESQTKREVDLMLEVMMEPNKMLRATLKSPLKTATAEAMITDTDTEKSAMVRFQHDKSEYYGKIGVSAKGNDAKRIYQPLIEYHTPNDIVKTKGNRKPDYHVDGQVIVEQSGDKQKYTFDNVKLVSPNQPVIMFNGFIAREGRKYSTDLKVSSDKVGVNVKGDVEVSPNIDHIKLNAELSNTLDENLSFNMKYEMKRGPGAMENSLNLVHGPDLKSKTHVFTLGQSLKYKYENPTDFNFETKNKVSYPLVGLDIKLEGKATKKHVEYDVHIAYEKFKLESELDAKVNHKAPGSYDIEFELEAMSNKVELKAKRDIAGDKSTIANMLQFNGKKYQVDGTVTHHLKANDVNMGTDLTIKIHEKPEPIKVKTQVIANPKEIDSFAKVTMGKTNLIDMMVKGTKGPNPNGSMKMFVLDLVNANGNFKATDGVGSANVLVDIPKMGRKLKAEGTFTCKEPHHNMNLDVYFDFEKDNSQKLHVETINQITKTSIDSKNKADFFGHKMEANMKGKMDGTFTDGKLEGDFDVLLPNDHYLTGKLNREVHMVNNIVNGNAHLTLEHKPKKAGPGHKLDIKANVKDTNRDGKTFDITYNIAAHTMDDKAIKADLVLKHTHEGEKHHSLYKSKLYGSLMPKPLEVEVSGTYTRREGTYKGHGKYGANMGINVAGKYNVLGGQTPITGEIDVEVMTPNDKYKNMKAHAGGSLKMPHEHGDQFEISGKTSATLNNEKTMQLEGHLKTQKHAGDMKVTVTLPHEEPMSLGAHYKHEETSPGFGKCNCGLDIHYGKAKNVKLDMTMVRPNGEEMDMTFDLVTPSETAKHINLQIKGKKSQGGKHFNSDIILTADDKSYSLTNELIISETNPSVDIKIVYPDKKTSRIYAKFTRLAPKKFNGEVKIESLKDFSLDMNGEANLESVDDFHIVMNIHSDKLKLDKVKLEAINKANKNGKKIQFSAKSGEKNLLSGSTNYKAHEEGGKFIVEGSGSFKVKEETRSANFKYIRQNLVQDKDGEQGIEIVLNAGIGAQGIVGELKLTNKQFRILNSYCEEKKQCAHVEVFSKASSDDATHFNHELEVNIDLRKLGLSHEFGLKAVTNRKNFILDHTVDVHFESSANSKYQYSLFVHPKEAGIVLTMPKRVIALEAKADFPTSKNRLGPIKGEIAFYMNKMAEPTKKTVLSFLSDQTATDKSGHITMEVKFTNPNLNKELMVKYEANYDSPAKSADFTVELDIFGKKSNKITINGLSKVTKLEEGYKLLGEVKMVSKGLNLEVKATEYISIQPKDYSYGYKLNYHLDKTKSESEILAKANMKEEELLIKLMNKDLLHIKSKLDLTKEKQTADTTISAYGIKPMVTFLEIKNFNTVIYTMARKDTPKNKLHVSSGFILGQIADFRAEVIKGANKIPLVHASVKLDDANFMKPDFGIDVDQIQKSVLEPTRVELEAATGELKKLVDEYQKSISENMKTIQELMKKNVPNLKPMIAYYQTELNKLKEELISDKTVQEVTEFLKKIFGAAAHTLSELFTKLSEITEKMIHMMQEHFTKITDVISKDVLPAVKEIGGKILNFYVSIMKSVYDVAMLYIVKLSDLLKAHQAELKQVATTLSAAFQDISQMVFRSLQNVSAELKQVLQDLFEQLKALPIFDVLKERYNELTQGLPVPDHVINIMNEVFSTIKDGLPTQEMKDFVTAFQTYLTKKLKQEKVDDAEAFKNMYTILMKAINSMINFIRSHHGSTEDVKGMFENMLPLPMDTMINLPRLIVVKLSPLRLLTSGELPSIREILHQISFNPSDLIPPFEHHAIMVQGQHIFTFDERHLTFPGVCSYVLAKDVINNNFTIVGTYKDGLLEALTFSDKKDVVTVKKGDQVTVNGVPSEMPVRHKELEVFRLYDTVNIVSKAGVQIICEPNLLGCGFHISGFYHGQMRGLFGNGNNEPFDDFMLPHGKIALKEDAFGNAYKVGAGCANVKTVDHHHHHANPTCDALFGIESSMRLCFPFVDTSNFKQACEHGMASNIADTEKAIAMAYVAACRHRNIPINTPSKFVKCMNSDTPMDMGTTFSVRVPGKSADVVIVVEQNKNNEVIFKELVQPMVTALTNELTSKGITDIDFSLIGFGGEYQKWPSHYTSGGKLAFHGKSATLKFVDPPKYEPIHTGHRQFDEILDKFIHAKEMIKMHLSMTPAGFAVREGLNYPFRAQAVKTIVVVPGHSDTSNVPLISLLKYIVLYGQTNGLKMNIITPSTIKVKDVKQQKNIIGFNDHAAFTFADAKKKSENSELLKDIDYEDPSVEFVQKMHGNVFSSPNFVSAKPAQRKIFLQEVSRQIAQQMTNVEQTLDCQCKMSNPYDAKNVCRVTSTKDKHTGKKGGRK